MSKLRSAGSTIMKAVRISQFGGPEVLKVETNVAVPKPVENKILIKVHAAGVNPVDTYIRTGTYAVKPELPYTPGFDVAGVVEDIGPSVTKFKKGDRVFTIATDSGGYAEYAVSDVNKTGYLDDNLTFEEGAGICIPYVTAFRAVVLMGNAKKGETILVHGASGAVGLACVQIAKSLGLRVIGTAGTSEGINLTVSHGADAVFNHREDGYTDKIMGACDGSGPNVIIEMLANINLEKDLQMAAPGGRIMLVGSRGSIEVTPRLVMGKELSIHGMTYFKTSQEHFVSIFDHIAKGMSAGWLHPHVGKTFLLEQAQDAHEEIINTKGAQGKLVLKL